MNSNRLFALFILAVILLTACSSSQFEPNLAAAQSPAGDTAQTGPEQPTLLTTESTQPTEKAADLEPGDPGDQAQAVWPDGEVRLDEQGFVEVAVTPLNLNDSDGSLNFSVGLNTHSVDLGMDLASLATLRADNGLGVDASLWDAPLGGHHVSGILSFPATAEGVSLLSGASRLTLIIRDVDAPERTFDWHISN